MTREIEMKFSVGDLGALRKAVLRAGGEYAGTVLQTDCYFDTPEMGLMRQDRGLRLRTSQQVGQATPADPGIVGRASPAGSLLGLPRRAMPALPALVTYKGPRAAGGRAKSRREIQTTVADPRAVEEMLKELGLTRRLVIQKRRSTYRLGGCLVELDELPLLGRFVEIEGAAAGTIESVARLLGLVGKPTKAGYAQLAVAACPRLGKGCLEVTFRHCGRRCARKGTKART